MLKMKLTDLHKLIFKEHLRRLTDSPLDIPNSFLTEYYKQSKIVAMEILHNQTKSIVATPYGLNHQGEKIMEGNVELPCTVLMVDPESKEENIYKMVELHNRMATIEDGHGNQIGKFRVENISIIVI